MSAASLARRIWQKKQSLHAVKERFFAKSNDARATKVIFQRPLKVQGNINTPSFGARLAQIWALVE